MKKVKSNYKVAALVLAGALLGSSILASGQAQAGETKSLEEQLQEWEAAGIDVNHTEAIEKIREYIAQNVDSGTFSSLHIDRENPLGVIVLSFTKEISPQMQEEIEALAEKPAEVSFRVVKYTEEQLMAKQKEIDEAVFEQEVFKKDGFMVYHTSTDIINNKVEVGISPFNEQTAQIVYDKFGSDMVQVVEGHEVQLENAEDSAQEVEAVIMHATEEPQEQPQDKGFFAKIWTWFVGLFK